MRVLATRKFWLKVGLMVASLAAVVGSLGGENWLAPTANAASCNSGPIVAMGRRVWCGYFTNQLDWGASPYPTGGFVLNPIAPNTNAIPFSVNDANSFINFIQSRRNMPTGQERTGAEFIIDTMLGYSAGSSGAQRNDAWNNFNEWARRVTALDNAGMIDWTHKTPFPCGILNTFYQRGGSNDDAWFFESPASGDGCGPRATVDTIVFKDPANGKIVYTLKRQCANPIGDLSAIPQVNFKLIPSGWETPKYQVTRGDTGTIHVQLHNNGPGASETGAVEVHPVIGGTTTGPGNGRVGGGSAIAGYIMAPGGGCAAPNQTALKTGATTQSTGDGYRGGSSIGEPTPDWYWDTKSLRSGVTATATFNFCVANTAQVGFVTFNICVKPADQNNATTCNHVTVQIISERYPSVVGENSDIHAGGAVGLTCPTGTPAGNVYGNITNNGSFGHFAVSASGVITDFGSNATASAPAGNRLKIGSNGAYSCIPRPDLMTAADNYRAGRSGYGTIGTAHVDVGSLTTFPVYYYDGGDLYIHGTVHNKLTIVAKNGNIHVEGPLGIDTSNFAPREDVSAGVAGPPSLGVVSGRDIDIEAAVTQVDGYLFAYGAIDTCEEGNIPPFNKCNGPQLVVNGFMMGDHVYLHRTGVVDTFGNAAAERVDLIPQLYLNPPKFFDATVDQLLLSGQGEKEPLF